MTEPTLHDFFSLWPLYERAVIASSLIGLVLGAIGVYIVLRRLVFLSAAVSQLASLGVALTFYLGHALGDPAWVPDPIVGAILVAFVATGAVAGRRGRSSVWRDSVLGGLFLVGAAGTLAVGTRILQDVADIDSLLFGSAVAVTPGDLTVTAWVFGAAMLLHAVLWRGFAAVSFSLADARVRGIPVRGLEATLFLTFAVTLSVGTRVIGALPVFALSVLPAVVGARLAKNLPMALVASGLIGALAGLYGYLLAFFLELPVGPSQVLIAAAFALLAEVARAASTLPATPARNDAARLSPALGVAALVAGAALLLRPLLAGVGVALDADLANPALMTSALIAALALALVGAAGSLAPARRGALGRWAVLSLWLALALAAPLDDALVRPIIGGFGALAVARAFRQARAMGTS